MFFKDKVVQSMVIFCTGGHTFPIHNLTSESEVIINLLAVYNVFDGQYPAAHGFLSLINKYTLQSIEADATADTSKENIRHSARINAAKKRKILNHCAKITTSAKFKEFVDSFEIFVSSLDGNP